jgi:hypothetical protein
VVGRRCGVAKNQIAFPFQEQTVGLAPAFGDGDGFRRQFLPGFRRLLAIHFLHPQQQPQARGTGAGIFVDHAPFLIAFHQLFQAFRRVFQLVFVVDKGEIAVIKRHKRVVIPAARYRDRAGRYLAFGEQFALRSRFQQVVVQPEHHIGFAILAFHPQTIKQRNAIFQRHELQFTVAVGFKGFFTTGPGPQSAEKES